MLDGAYDYYYNGRWPNQRVPLGAFTESKAVFELRAPSSCRGLTVLVTDPDVWPTIPAIGEPSWYHNVVGPASTTVTARLSQPAGSGGCDVNFGTPEPVAASGGHHLHIAPPERPHGTMDQPSCTIDQGQTYCMNTYASSEVAGEEKIKATLADTGETAETTINVKVPGLEPMPTAGYYRLVGSYGEPGVNSQHHDNHYGAPSTEIGLMIIANDYLGETDYMLQINDMSLYMGGLFDVSNNWLPGPIGHKWHRVGLNADIGKLMLNYNDPSQSVEIACLEDLDLKKIVNDLGWATLICESEGRKHIEFKYPPQN